MLEFTSLVITLPIELGSALMNLTGIPSAPEAFLLSRPFIMEMTSDSETSDSWKVHEATEQNDKGEVDMVGRLQASLSATERKKLFKSSGVKSRFATEPDGCDPLCDMYWNWTKTF